jgi:hypothetical protein
MKYPTCNQKKVGLAGHILRISCLQKHITEEKIGGEDEKEDVSSSLMTLRKQNDSGNCNTQL